MPRIWFADTVRIARENGLDPDVSEAVDVARFDSIEYTDDGDAQYDEDTYRAALAEYVELEIAEDQLIVTAARSAGPTIKRDGDFFRPNLADAMWQSSESLDLVASGLGQLPRSWEQTTLRSILTAERHLAAGIEDLLVPFHGACQVCGAQRGEPCTANCDAQVNALADADDRIGCMDCGALTGERCRATCARYADL